MGRQTESPFISEGWKKPAKILVLSFLVCIYLFFFIWGLVSPFVKGPIPSDVVRFSFALFFALSLIFTFAIYNGYIAAFCPYCEKKLFFHTKSEGIRCFRCGRFMKIDLQKRVIFDPLGKRE